MMHVIIMKEARLCEPKLRGFRAEGGGKPVGMVSEGDGNANWRCNLENPETRGATSPLSQLHGFPTLEGCAQPNKATGSQVTFPQHMCTQGTI